MNDPNDRDRKVYLVQELFRILKEYPDGSLAKDAVAALKSRIELAEYETEAHQGRVSIFNKIVRFATIGPFKAG